MLLDPSAVFFSAPAATDRAQAASLNAERQLYLLQAEAARAWFEVADLDAQLVGTTAHRDTLMSQLTAVRAGEAAGTALRVDRLRLEVALTELEMQIARLERARDLARWSLGAAVGSDGPVEPEGASMDLRIDGDFEDLVGAIAGRDDMRALDLEFRSVERERRGILAEALPTLEAWGEWSDPGIEALSEDTLVAVGAKLTWVPVAAGTRALRLSAKQWEREALEAQQVETERAATHELRTSLAQAELARLAVDVSERTLEQAREAAVIVRARYREGLTPLSELLAAEAALGNTQVGLERSRIAATGAAVAVRVAAGFPLEI